MTKLLVLVAVPLIVFACGGSSDASGSTSESIEATSYSQACKVDGDCTAVYSGELCGTCGCPSWAIATSDYDAYRAAQTKAFDACADKVVHTCNCPNATASCNAGTCQFGR